MPIETPEEIPRTTDLTEANCLIEFTFTRNAESLLRRLFASQALVA